MRENRTSGLMSGEGRRAKGVWREPPPHPRLYPRALVTDKLKSYGAAQREIMPGVEHRQSRFKSVR